MALGSFFGNFAPQTAPKEDPPIREVHVPPSKRKSNLEVPIATPAQQRKMLQDFFKSTPEEMAAIMQGPHWEEYKDAAYAVSGRTTRDPMSAALGIMNPPSKVSKPLLLEERARKKAPPPATKPAVTPEEKAHQERVARIKHAEETGTFDNQYLQDKTAEEAYARGDKSGKTVAQKASENAAGDKGQSPSGSGINAKGDVKPSTDPTPEARGDYTRNQDTEMIGYLLAAAREAQDPSTRAVLEQFASKKYNDLQQRDVREQFGSAGLSQWLNAQQPYNAQTNPGGWQAPANGGVAPGAAAQVMANMQIQQMQRNAAEVARLTQAYGRGAGALEFLRPGSPSYNGFQALSPSQQLAAINAAVAYKGPALNQNTRNAAGNYTELWRKAGMAAPAVDPARFAPGYRWQPPQQGAVPLAPTPQAPVPQAPMPAPAPAVDPATGLPIPNVNPYAPYSAGF